MRHAQLIKPEVGNNSTKSDLDEGGFLDEGAVQELLEQGYEQTGEYDAIAGIGKGVVLGAAMWILMLSVVARVL